MSKEILKQLDTDEVDFLQEQIFEWVEKCIRSET
jgi:hypothetical protein